MNISNDLNILGIAGSFAAGKDTLADQLVKDFGYTHVSTGDIVREFAMKERGSIERPILFAVANKLRHEIGADALVVKALEKPRPLVVSGIRSLGEAKAIKKAGGTLVFVDAPLRLRFERMKVRLRDHEVGLSIEEFEARESNEWYSGDSDTDFNLRGIKDMSDVVIDNALPLNEFLHAAYKDLGFEQPKDGAGAHGTDAHQT